MWLTLRLLGVGKDFGKINKQSLRAGGPAACYSWSLRNVEDLVRALDSKAQCSDEMQSIGLCTVKGTIGVNVSIYRLVSDMGAGLARIQLAYLDPAEPC